MSALASTDNLFDAGALDSLGVTRVVVFLEDMIDEEIELDLSTIDDFSTIDSIYRRFVQS